MPLIINRHGPPELAEVFKRVNQEQMAEYCSRHSISPRDKDDWLSYKPHMLLAAYIEYVYAHMAEKVNSALYSSHGRLPAGAAVVIYSPLDHGWRRGDTKPVSWTPQDDKICDEAEQAFIMDLAAPFPDIARRFDSTIF